MENVNNPSEADTPVEGVTTGEANENVSNTGTLDAINEATGRSYKSEEEAIKGIKETTSYVGKVGKYKDVIEAVEAAKGGEQGAIEALKGLTKEEKPIESDSVESDPVAEIKAELETVKEESFFNANPDLVAHRELIGKLKKPGETLAQTVEGNKEVLDTLKAGAENQTSESVIHSNSRTVAEGSDYTEDLKKAKETGNWTDFLQKHKGMKLE